MSEFDLIMENLNPTQIQLATHNYLPRLLDTYDRYMYLMIYVDDNNDLKNRYIDAALNHNNKILNLDNKFLDAGFDLYCPVKKEYYANNMNTVNKIDHNVICSAQMLTSFNKIYNTGYYMYPRSSISKSKLRLANSTGIIDAGYRGHLMGMFDLINLEPDEEYIIDKHDRLLQICAPGLVPILVEVVNRIEELGTQTERGTGGFGSSGR